MRLSISIVATLSILGLAVGCGEDLPPGCAPIECTPGATVRAAMSTPLAPGTYDLTITAGTERINGAVDVSDGRDATCEPAFRCFSTCTETLCAEVVGVLDGVSLSIVVKDPAAASGPANFTIAVDYDGQRLGEERFAPAYEPDDGPGCPPKCLVADGLEMALVVPTATSQRAD